MEESSRVKREAPPTQPRECIDHPNPTNTADCHQPANSGVPNDKCSDQLTPQGDTTNHKSTHTAAQKRKRNRKQHASRSKRRQLKRDILLRNLPEIERRNREAWLTVSDDERSDDGDTLPHEHWLKDPAHTHKTPTGRPVGESFLYHRLEKKPNVPIEVTSKQLLQCAFPHGISIQWPKEMVRYTRTSARHVHGLKLSGPKIPVVDNNVVPTFLRTTQQRDQRRIKMTELTSVKDITDFVAGPIGVHTAFVARVVVAPLKQRGPTTICHPAARPKSQRKKYTPEDNNDDNDNNNDNIKRESDESETHQPAPVVAQGQESTRTKPDIDYQPVSTYESNYLTYIVILPHIGVFYTDYGFIHNNKTSPLVPLPVSWLVLPYQQREQPVRRYIKRFVLGDGGIFRIDVYPVILTKSLKRKRPAKQEPGGMGTTSTTSRSHGLPVLPRIIHGIHLHDSNPLAPLIPPDTFSNDDTNGSVESIDHDDIKVRLSHVPPLTNNVDDRRRRYREELNKDTTRYRHLRGCIRGTSHTHIDPNHCNVLDQREIGDFDLCIRCHSKEAKEVHTSFIRVRVASDEVTSAIQCLGRHNVDGSNDQHSGIKSDPGTDSSNDLLSDTRNSHRGSVHPLLKCGKIAQHLLPQYHLTPSGHTTQPTTTTTIKGEDRDSGIKEDDDDRGIKEEEEEEEAPSTEMSTHDATREHNHAILDRIDHLNNLNNAAIRFLRRDYNELLSTFQCMLLSGHRSEEDNTTSPANKLNKRSVIASNMDLIVDRCDASHYNMNDSSYRVGIWASDDGNDVDDWVMVLPNVHLTNEDVGEKHEMGSTKAKLTTDNNNNDNHPRKGIVIRLFHGCAISCEGNEIRHALTRKVQVDCTNPSNHTYAAVWYPSQQHHRLRPAANIKMEEDSVE